MARHGWPCPFGCGFYVGAMGSKPPKVLWLSDQNRQLLGPQPGQQAQAAVAGLHAALAGEFGPVASTEASSLSGSVPMRP